MSAVVLEQQLAKEEETAFNNDLSKQFVEVEKHYIEDLHYKRIDESVFAHFTQAQIERNAIHGSLSGYEMIAKYQVYQKDDDRDIICLVAIGDRLCGHPEIVHGGIISAIFDNNFGWVFVAAKEKPAFTANLNVNFRKPIYANNVGIIKAKIDRVEGRKIFLAATWESVGGELLADATSLFIRPKEAEGK